MIDKKNKLFFKVSIKFYNILPLQKFQVKI